MRFKYIAVDTEGYAPNLLGISIANPALQSMYFPLGHKEKDVNIDDEVREALAYCLYNVPCRIMHHAGHDIVALPFIADRPFICTMIMTHMVDENLMSKALDYLHKTICGGEGKKVDPLMESIIKTMGWEYVPFELMNLYAAWDARMTMEIFLKILPRYEEEFGPVWSSPLESLSANHSADLHTFRSISNS